MRIDNVSHYIVLDESLLEISIGVHMTLIPLGILTDTRKKSRGSTSCSFMFTR